MVPQEIFQVHIILSTTVVPVMVLLLLFYVTIPLRFHGYAFLVKKLHRIVNFTTDFWFLWLLESLWVQELSCRYINCGWVLFPVF